MSVNCRSILILGLLATLSGCAMGPGYYGPGPLYGHRKALIGGAIGGAGGALLGHVATGDPAATAAGGALGAVVGGLVGNSMDRRDQGGYGYYDNGGYYGGGHRRRHRHRYRDYDYD